MISPTNWRHNSVNLFREQNYRTTFAIAVNTTHDEKKSWWTQNSIYPGEHLVSFEALKRLLKGGPATLINKVNLKLNV